MTETYKKLNKTRLFKSNGDVEIKIKSIANNKSKIWVRKENSDITLALLMYDFLDEFSDNLNAVINICNENDGSRSFIVESVDDYIIVQEILNFIEKWEIDVGEKNIKFTCDDWNSA